MWLLIAVLFFFWPLLLLLLMRNPKMGAKAGARYTAVQLLMWWATVIGWFVLIVPCCKQAWIVDATSIADSLEPRPALISRWAWRWLNLAWGNPHEGVSGQEALIRDAQGNQHPYLPDSNPAWRAWSWCAWRNSCDALKYRFAWDAGPLVTMTLLGRSIRFGWLPMPQIKGSPRVPVLL